MTPLITIEDFLKVDIRLGRVVEVLPFPQAWKASYKVIVDLGPGLGKKSSCAQLPPNYTADQLEGLLVACVTNLPPRQIGPNLSEILILGFPDESGNAVLVTPTREIPLGGRLF